MVRSVRTVAILAAVGALVTAIALPAFASGATSHARAATTTTQQLAASHAQSIVVASEATAAPAVRSAFTATTPDQIEQKKAEEAAAARAAQAAKTAGVTARLNLSMVSPGSGQVRWPVLPGQFTPGEGLDAGRNHQGWDLLAPGGTPIYAATAGTVTVSSEDYFGYGVAVVIDGQVAGNDIQTTYAHMTYGSRLVQQGQRVSAGQMIGLVGDTGHAFGTHLHFEVRLNGSVIDPQSWLQANAG
ncbi:M23 family metallopeptidase [Microbacterium capsulatum]|uniref:M23 family metallopeptidase n=1 Tax=Microbacterium capsulatum TaxID=3041921 RepID=A0ABU0XFA4_9MICO|nr:M23 family metallopeptidase [Microbacterium sp. ASV81]MDQ4213796.1 M23 family metallopeptidase [Microbacterium sp. ASV81]